MNEKSSESIPTGTGDWVAEGETLTSPNGYPYYVPNGKSAYRLCDEINKKGAGAMSTNCVVCVKNKRTGFDLLCDDCREKEKQSPAKPTESASGIQKTEGKEGDATSLTKLKTTVKAAPTSNPEGAANESWTLKLAIEEINSLRSRLAESIPAGAGEQFPDDRLFDLVRYQRAELHQAELITDDEYAALCESGATGERKGSRVRLETYDELRATVTALSARAEEAWEIAANLCAELTKVQEKNSALRSQLKTAQDALEKIEQLGIFGEANQAVLIARAALGKPGEDSGIKEPQKADSPRPTEKP